MEERKFERFDSTGLVYMLPGYVGRHPRRTVDPRKEATMTLEELSQMIMRLFDEQSKNDESSSQ